MNLFESFLTAIDSLRANKLRATLTMLGVIIGVAAVIALMSVGNGVNSFVTGEIQAIGTNLISISTDREVTGGAPALSMADVEALSDPLLAPAVGRLSATASGNQEVLFEGSSFRTSVSGVLPAHFGINSYTPALGGILTNNDLEVRARVAVLGWTAAEELFAGEFPIGKEVRINGVAYEVVGVLEEKGGFTGGDSTLFIPLTTAQSRLYPARTRSGERAVDSITVEAVSGDAVDAATEQITQILREQHEIVYAADDDFQIFSQTDLLDTFGAITTGLTVFLGAIAGISLLVGGIGIMNIMLVSVTERTREIGIRKAVGALRRDILLQFLIESLVLSLVGGLLGIALGVGIAMAIDPFLPDFSPVINLGTVVLASSFAGLVGLVFGIYPAWRAAGLRPIEALRYE